MIRHLRPRKKPASTLGGGSSPFAFFGQAGGGSPPVQYTYRRPGGADTYHRPDGTSIFHRP